jgi:hypothetical protein
MLVLLMLKRGTGEHTAATARGYRKVAAFCGNLAASSWRSNESHLTRRCLCAARMNHGSRLTADHECKYAAMEVPASLAVRPCDQADACGEDAGISHVALRVLGVRVKSSHHACDEFLRFTKGVKPRDCRDPCGGASCHGE